MKRPKVRDLTPEQNEVFREIGRDLAKAHGSGSALGRALDMKQPSISTWLNGKTGLGRDAAAALARLAGIDFEAAMRGQRVPASPDVTTDPRYPEIAAALGEVYLPEIITLGARALSAVGGRLSVPALDDAAQFAQRRRRADVPTVAGPLTPATPMPVTPKAKDLRHVIAAERTPQPKTEKKTS